ncbi:hypothetical protein chiPu_0003340 [Chiloscyllium punctatum]|uniref:Laminin G domain-containing protein n=1 Tax=Chiloscyllium punctatum TaxID=137246 RepID=A0A401S3F4_CHIPU|nr:hypothetical protein [Chiloscyllium punctatum]
MVWRSFGVALILSSCLCASRCGPIAEGDPELGSGAPLTVDEVDLLDKLASFSFDLTNISLSLDEENCTVYEVGQYSTLSIPSREVFGSSFADEFSLLIKLRYTMREDTILFTILSYQSHILLQVRLSPSAFVFVTTRRRHYEFPIAFLSDGKWHKVAISVSLNKMEVYVDCKLIESVRWKNYFGMEITTEGLVIIGGLIEAFETPFKGLIQQLLFVMGEPTAAKAQCTRYNRACRETSEAETVLNGSGFHQDNYFLPVQSEGSEYTTPRTHARSTLSENLAQGSPRKNPPVDISVTNAGLGRPIENDQHGSTELLNITYNEITNSGPAWPGINISNPTFILNSTGISNAIPQVLDFRLNKMQGKNDEWTNLETSNKLDELIGKEFYFSNTEDQEGITIHGDKQDGGLVVSDESTMSLTTPKAYTDLQTNSSISTPRDVIWSQKETGSQQKENMLAEHDNLADSKRMRWYEVDIDLEGERFRGENSKGEIGSKAGTTEMDHIEETFHWENDRHHEISKSAGNQTVIHPNPRGQMRKRKGRPGPPGPPGPPGSIVSNHKITERENTKN